MVLTQFFIWWYGRGWRDAAGRLQRRVQAVNNAFSVKQLLGTLFAPWRRIVSHPGASLSDHFHAWLDNLVSRFIGFIIRFFVLVGAAVALLITTVVTVIEIITWPCLPPAVVILFIVGVIA